MTYNIRNGTAPDGINHWDHRKELCLARVVAFHPDVLGLQEAMDFQNDYLLKNLPGYTALGVGRDGKNLGEFSTLIYRNEYLEVVDSGTFWLSMTTEVVGSRSWDSAHPRIATWALFQKKNSRFRFLAINTHFDHRGVTARIEAAKLIRNFALNKGGDLPILITGDFNSQPDSEPYRILQGLESNEKSWVDAYVEYWKGRGAEAESGTTNSFKIRPAKSRIDWIFHSSPLRVREAQIDRSHQAPVFPSDHYPMTAILEWGNTKP